MPTVFTVDEWKSKYQQVLKVFKEFNETFPSGFLDKNIKSGIRCFTGTDKMQGIDFWMGLELHGIDCNETEWNGMGLTRTEWVQLT